MRVKKFHAAIDITPRHLRAVREARGLGLREAARAADIDAAHLSRVERGVGHLSVPALGRLARVLGLREFERMAAIFPTRPVGARR